MLIILQIFCYLILQTTWNISIIIFWCRKWGLEGTRDRCKVPELGRVGTGVKTRQSGNKAWTLNGGPVLLPGHSWERTGLCLRTLPSGLINFLQREPAWSISPRQMCIAPRIKKAQDVNIRAPVSSPSFLIGFTYQTHLIKRNQCQLCSSKILELKLTPYMG